MENTKEQVVAEWKAVNEPRLKEIKSANPDLYSAINLALNYLNKKLTGEELPADVEEEVVIETQLEPIETIQKQWKLEDFDNTKINVYTPEESKKFQELILSLGGNGFIGGKIEFTDKPYLFVYPKGDLAWGEKLADFNNNEKREIFYDDIFPPVMQTQQEIEDYRFMTAKEIGDKFFKGVAQNDVHGIGLDIWEDNFANKKLSELAKDEFDFKEQLNNAKNSILVNFLGFGILSEYLVPVEQEETSTQQEIEDYRFMTAKEIEDKFFKGVTQSKFFGLSRGYWESVFANQKLSELAKDEDDFKEQISNAQKQILVNVSGYAILSKYLVPIGQQKTQSKPKTNADFKVGDKVKLPLTKSEGGDYDTSGAIQNAKHLGQDYLYVRTTNPAKPDRIGLWHTTTSSVGDNFSVSKDNIELYDATQSTQTTSTTATSTPATQNWTPQDLVGKKVQSVRNGTIYSVDKLIKNNPKNKKYEITNLSTQQKETWDIQFIVVENLLNNLQSAGYIMVSDTTQTSTPQTTQTPANQPVQWKPKDLVGRRVIYTPKGQEWEVIELKRINPQSKSYTIRRVSDKWTQKHVFQDFTLQKLFDEGKSDKWELVPQQPTKQLYTLNIETEPAQVEYNLFLSKNRGDRNSPTQSAGELKTMYSDNPDASNTILNTKFKGNDGEWYKIHVGTSGTWTWRKAK